MMVRLLKQYKKQQNLVTTKEQIGITNRTEFRDKVVFSISQKNNLEKIGISNKNHKFFLTSNHFYLTSI